MTWYYHPATDWSSVDLFYADGQGNQYGPWTVPNENAPARTFSSNGGLPSKPPCHERAVKEAKNYAANGNTQLALSMSLDLQAGDVQEGQP